MGVTTFGIIGHRTKMKIVSAAILRQNGTAEPTILSSAFSLAHFSFFQRNTVKEMLTFFTRTFIKQTQPGQRQSIEHQEYIAHVYVNAQGIGTAFFCDQEYPSRVAFSIMNSVLEEFQQQVPSATYTKAGENGCEFPRLEEAIESYQDPSKADKITQIQKDLDETKIILHKTIDSVLERGEKLDELVTKSSDLSGASKTFYKTAKKQNQCCSFM
eukprot:GFYU01000407.1.p2 GENE.GFYU01000407.1~~GFYU01000407.1.p2  ORF type:complete len:214 (-),score=63.15 GFYU01000407.1:418-1059(-)